jgi:hypothetical protein
MTGRQENVIFGDGVISTGDKSRVNNAKGNWNRQVNADTAMPASGQDPWVLLAAELARIRQRLEEDRSGSVAMVDRDDAIASVEAAQGEVSATDKTSPEVRRSIRLRIKGLIGILVPVAEIIGGVAGLEAIWPHL